MSEILSILNEMKDDFDICVKRGASVETAGVLIYWLCTRISIQASFSSVPSLGYFDKLPPISIQNHHFLIIPRLLWMTTSNYLHTGSQKINPAASPSGGITTKPVVAKHKYDGTNPFPPYQMAIHEEL
jgi:hypothetical protein